MEGIRAGAGQDYHQHSDSSTLTGNTHHGHEEKGSSSSNAPPTPPSPGILSPKQGAEAMVESGVNRHATRIDVLFLKAFWGGMFLSYGGMLEAVIGGSMWEMTNNPGLLRLVEGLVFPVGLAMIVFSGTDLLTSDMMFLFIAALKGRVPWWGVLLNNFVVFWGNLAGSLFFAAILGKYTDLATVDAVRTFVVNTAETRAGANWRALFLRGIGCNIMVCMAVYLAALGSSLASKAVGIWIALGTFVVIQFEHVIADMFTIPLGILLGAEVGVTTYIWRPLLGALFGNFVGAWVLSLTFYWCYLHDTSASPVISKSDVEENRQAIGPFGYKSFGKGTKLQNRLGHHHTHEGFKNAGYARDHF